MKSCSGGLHFGHIELYEEECARFVMRKYLSIQFIFRDAQGTSAFCVLCSDILLSSKLWPLLPAAKMKLAILAAKPRLMVMTSDLICCMQSKMASPEITEPPGQLMYKQIGLEESSESKYSITPITWLASSSSISDPKKMIRSRYKRLQISTQSACCDPGTRYATLGTPIGIILTLAAPDDICRLLFLDPQTLEATTLLDMGLIAP